MATVTPGKVFSTNEIVTPTNLNALGVPTVSNIVTADLVDANVTTAKIADANVTTAKIADANVTTAKIADGAVTQSKLNSSVTLVPTGAVMPFAMNSAPSGWLAADGNEYSKTGTYAGLFAVISTTYGETNGAGVSVTGGTHFRVPDLRGIFVRGSGTQAIDGITYNKTFGNKEADAFQGHRHSLLANTFLITSASSNWLQGGNPAVNNATTGIGSPSTDTVNGTPRTAVETRPANIALLYCIKI
jgi:microcystin-dependent protein